MVGGSGRCGGRGMGGDWEVFRGWEESGGVVREGLEGDRRSRCVGFTPCIAISISSSSDSIYRPSTDSKASRAQGVLGMCMLHFKAALFLRTI